MKYQFVDTSGKRPKTECPFHRDYYDSLRLFDEKDEYICFDCGAHGTSVDLIMKLKSLSEEEALALLKSASQAEESSFSVSYVIRRIEDINQMLLGEMVTLSNEIAKNREFIKVLKDKRNC